MAATIIHGKGGSFTWTDGTIAQLGEGELSWVIGITGSTADTTSMDDALMVGRVGTWKSWTATATVNDMDAEYTEANIFHATTGLGFSAELALLDGTNTYTGTGILTGFNKSMDIEGVFNVTFNFQGTGAVVLS